MDILQHKVTVYNSVEIIDNRVADGKFTEDEFKTILKASLSHWKDDGKVGIYLDLPKAAAKLIPIALANGFKYHHAHEDYLMLTCWLDDSSESRLPPGPCHFVGVGGIVLYNKSDNKASQNLEDYQILVVQEKSGPSVKFADFWKTPGGLVDSNEDIAQAAVREVLEETGIETSFNQICCIREFHNGNYSKTRKNSSELYAFCSLELNDPSQREITIQEDEIKAATWMNLNEFLNSTIYKSRRDFFAVLTRQAIDVCLGRKPGFSYMKKRKQSGYFSKTDSKL